MDREMILTVAIYLFLIALALTSIPGLVVTFGWLAVGVWFVSKTRSRGLGADVSFVATWPLYLVLGR
jgi:hypothetical protein